jgi:hypothetical protein
VARTAHSALRRTRTCRRPSRCKDRPPPDRTPSRPCRAGPAHLRPVVGAAASCSWFVVLLFLLVLACGVGLAAFTLLRPYLTH